MLQHNRDLARWLQAAGYIAPEWSGTKDLAAIRKFREELREAVVRHEAGAALPPGFVEELNGLLYKHPVREALAVTAHGCERQRVFQPKQPVDALEPILEDVLTLFTAEQARIRKCDACELHFHDTSKKGLRRWCSMNVCGNRAKVAAYARRKKAQ